MNRPCFKVIDFKVEVLPDNQVVTAVFLHEGQSFHFNLEKSLALSLSGALEDAYRKLQNPQMEASHG